MPGFISFKNVRQVYSFV